MGAGRGRLAVAALAAGVGLLFAGRWMALLLADRWWAEGVAPAAVPFLTQWHLLGLILEVGGILVAGAWCVGHFLWVVRSIGTVQVPRRLGNLEIRELMSGSTFRGAAILAGTLLGLLLGAGGSRAVPLVALAWQGAPMGTVDPVLGLDLGVYLAQLPLWEATLAFARHLTWAALLGAGIAHFAVGGLRAGRAGLAMTEVARRQLGLLTASALVLAALGEGLGPLRSVAGLDLGPWSGLAPALRWGVAAAWLAAAAVLAWWVAHPSARRLLAATLLWGLPLLFGTMGTAAVGEPPIAVAPGGTPIGARGTGAERHIETTLSADGRVERVEPGLWERRILPALVSDRAGARVLSAARERVPIGEERVPVWILLRDDSAGRALVLVADDRLSTGGGPVSFREGDGATYPGIVTWRALPGVMVVPEAPDSILANGPPGIPIGGTGHRLVLAWGTQSRAALSLGGTGASLWWRRAPRDRVHHLFPPAWWDEPRPFLRDGHLLWIVDGWFVGPGAALAPPVPWDGATLRYARPGLVAVVDAEGGGVRIFLRPDADAVAAAWTRIAGGLVQPADSIPDGILDASPSGRAVAVVARSLRPGDELPQATEVWGPRGPVPQVATEPAAGERLTGVLYGAGEAGYLTVRWPEGSGPFTPRALNARWGRFATLERLEDSVRRAGGRLEAGVVRYDLTTDAALAVRIRWAISAAGAPTVAWVEVAQGDRLGAARTPATALANLRGESAPVVPAPDLPDALHEARRWAGRADSALRAGDLEGFARAFEALKRVLGTP